MTVPRKGQALMRKQIEADVRSAEMAKARRAMWQQKPWSAPWSGKRKSPCETRAGSILNPKNAEALARSIEEAETVEPDHEAPRDRYEEGFWYESEDQE